MPWATHLDSALKDPGTDEPAPKQTSNQHQGALSASTVCPAAQLHIIRPLDTTCIWLYFGHCTWYMGELVGTNKLKPSPGSYHLSGSEAALVAEGNSLLVPEHLEGHSEAQGLGFGAVHWAEQRKRMATCPGSWRPTLGRKGKATYHYRPSQCSRSCQPASRGCHPPLPSPGCGLHGLPSFLQWRAGTLLRKNPFRWRLGCCPIPRGIPPTALAIPSGPTRPIGPQLYHKERMDPFSDRVL